MRNALHSDNVRAVRIKWEEARLHVEEGTSKSVTERARDHSLAKVDTTDFLSLETGPIHGEPINFLGARFETHFFKDRDVLVLPCSLYRNGFPSGENTLVGEYTIKDLLDTVLSETLNGRDPILLLTSVLMIPIWSKKRSHWTLLVVDNKAHRFELYDSLPGIDRGAQVTKKESVPVKNFLRKLADHLDVEPPNFNMYVLLYNVGPGGVKMPRQCEQECGIYVIVAMIYRGLGYVFDWSDKHSPFLRILIASSVLRFDPKLWKACLQDATPGDLVAASPEIPTDPAIHSYGSHASDTAVHAVHGEPLFPYMAPAPPLRGRRPWSPEHHDTPPPAGTLRPSFERAKQEFGVRFCVDNDPILGGATTAERTKRARLALYEL